MVRDRDLASSSTHAGVSKPVETKTAAEAAATKQTEEEKSVILLCGVAVVSYESMKQWGSRHFLFFSEGSHLV